VNVTDGRYTYMHPTDPSTPAECYSTTMLNPFGYFTPQEPKKDAEAGEFLPYTDTPVWRFTDSSWTQNEGPLLFDRQRDPTQDRDLTDEEPEQTERMRGLLATALGDLDAPASQYDRLEIDV